MLDFYVLGHLKGHCDLMGSHMVLLLVPPNSLKYLSFYYVVLLRYEEVVRWSNGVGGYSVGTDNSRLDTAAPLGSERNM